MTKSHINCTHFLFSVSGTKWKEKLVTFRSEIFSVDISASATTSLLLEGFFFARVSFLFSLFLSLGHSGGGATAEK